MGSEKVALSRTYGMSTRYVKTLYTGSLDEETHCYGHVNMVPLQSTNDNGSYTISFPSRGSTPASASSSLVVRASMFSLSSSPTSEDIFIDVDEFPVFILECSHRSDRRLFTWMNLHDFFDLSLPSGENAVCQWLSQLQLATDASFQI